MKIIIPPTRFLKSMSLTNHNAEFGWESGIDSAAYVLGDSQSHRSLRPIFELLDETEPPLISAAAERAFASLGVSSDNLPIDAVQSSASMIEKVKKCFDVSRRVLEDLKSVGYLDTFVECNRTLKRLSRARIDITSLHAAINSKEIKNISVAKGFFPKKDGFLEAPEYSITRTLTGRTTIISGPQILTAPKLIRKYLKSSYQGGKIIQVDFISLEPRVAMQLTENDLGLDIYEHLASKLFDEKVSRSVVKKLVLCAVYGASEATLKRGLPEGINISQIVEKTKKMLNYRQVVDEQAVNFEKTGKIRNFFGRPVEPQSARESLLYNNYIQSTAVDVSLLGFGQILDRCKLRAKPIFFIHDAMLLDVHPDDIEEFKNISSSIVIDGLGEFPLDFQVLG